MCSQGRAVIVSAHFKINTWGITDMKKKNRKFNLSDADLALVAGGRHGKEVCRPQ